MVWHQIITVRDVSMDVKLAPSKLNHTLDSAHPPALRDRSTQSTIALSRCFLEGIKINAPSSYTPWRSSNPTSLVIRESRWPRSGFLTLVRMCHTLTISQAPRNVVFIGETGSGKSSIINLIADHSHAVVSPDATPCTNDFAVYDVTIRGRMHRLWDTPGLNVPSGFSRLFRRKTSATRSIRRFLQERRRHGELDLLVFCVRGNSRASDAMAKAYKIFCRATRQVAIPVVIAITHLERAQPTMGAWWQDNERRFGNLGLVFDGHACLTCLSPHHRRWASQQDIRGLISAEYRPRAWSTVSDREYLNDPNSCVVC